MKRSHKTLIFLSIFAVGIISGGFLGSFLFSGAKDADAKTQIVEEPRILKFVTTHTLCGHISTYTEEQKQIFNSTEQIQSTFPKWSIRTVTDKEIVLDRQTADYCEHHYFVHLSGKDILIETRDGNLKQRIDTTPLSITDQEMATLTEGIYLNGQDALTAFIEDFTS